MSSIMMEFYANQETPAGPLHMCMKLEKEVVDKMVELRKANPGKYHLRDLDLVADARAALEQEKAAK